MNVPHKAIANAIGLARFNAMTGEIEAAGDVLTGGVIARTVEREANAGGHGAGAHGLCPNCRAMLTGPFCAQCGQGAHLHRSLHSLVHDILHGVFHFEGKIWRTLPELAFHPGRLTRRFIDGERAKFVSPMALFLFSVFAMFAVFSYTGGAFLDTGEGGGISNMSSAMKREIKVASSRLETIERLRKAPTITAEGRAKLDKEAADIRDDMMRMERLQKGDWSAVAKVRAADGTLVNPKMNVDLGIPWLDTTLEKSLTKATDNPSLLIYKLKSYGYKYSWALIPLSIPFLWLLFFWRRDIHLYDHAIFATYSISFMIILTIALSIAAALGVSSTIWGTMLTFVPPIHMYKQLRGAYALSRLGAVVRLFFLLNFTGIVLTIFAVLLIVLGLLE